MERRWEDLETDCLVCVFEKLEIRDLILGIPLVCKNWHKTLFVPQCWKKLDFSTLNFGPFGPFASDFKGQYLTDDFHVAGLMRLAIDCGRESVMELLTPSICGLDVLVYASHRCPNLKTLALPSLLVKEEESHLLPVFLSEEDRKPFFRLFSIWKDCDTVIHEISRHCMNFIGIKKTGIVTNKEALAIVSFLPGIKHLTMTSASMSRADFVMIIMYCKQLEELIVKDCCGFQVDEEILKMTSHINKFEYEDLRVEEDDRFYHHGDNNYWCEDSETSDIEVIEFS